MRKFENILVTGGAGFIGSNFIRFLFNQNDFHGRLINLDALTYAGNLENLSDVNREFGNSRYFFEKCDICDYEGVGEILKKYNIDCIVNFAAESHVDRSIAGPAKFIHTNILGTFSLLEAAKEFWMDRTDVLFHHVSTDEVYGSLDDSGCFYETTPYNPRSPYSASKASSDHIVSSFFHTYKMPVTVSNCSNNYGPYQFPEKLIPLILMNINDNKSLPVYGDGKNVRDWLFVDDHNSAVWLILKSGEIGETYNIGGENEWENIHLINVLCEKMAAYNGLDIDYYKKLITFVSDRPGHDRRYAINCDKIKKELGWEKAYDFSHGLDITVEWYMNNIGWVNTIKNGEYLNWILDNYSNRLLVV